MHFNNTYSILRTLCSLGNFTSFCRHVNFKNRLFKKIIEEYHQRVKEFGSRPSLASCIDIGLNFLQRLKLQVAGAYLKVKKQVGKEVGALTKVDCSQSILSFICLAKNGTVYEIFVIIAH